MMKHRLIVHAPRINRLFVVSYAMAASICPVLLTWPVLAAKAYTLSRSCTMLSATKPWSSWTYIADASCEGASSSNSPERTSLPAPLTTYITGSSGERMNCSGARQPGEPANTHAVRYALVASQAGDEREFGLAMLLAVSNELLLAYQARRVMRRRCVAHW